jgi:2',3'-cyclic-nucleotide 2'-phosphodiesterase (5'-nucleotidase family)
MELAQFPMLSANAVLSDTGELVAQPYVIRELTPDHRVAIIGLTDPDVTDLMRAIGERPMRVLDPVETAQRYVDEVSDKADIVIVLSHLGHDQDLVLAERVAGIDAIIGGKSGHLFDPPARPDPAGPVIAQAAALGRLLGVVRLDFDNQGNLLRSDGHPIVLGPDVADDPEMVELLDSYRHLEVSVPSAAPGGEGR